MAESKIYSTPSLNQMTFLTVTEKLRRPTVSGTNRLTTHTNFKSGGW